MKKKYAILVVVLISCWSVFASPVEVPSLKVQQEYGVWASDSGIYFMDFLEDGIFLEMTSYEVRFGTWTKINEKKLSVSTHNNALKWQVMINGDRLTVYKSDVVDMNYKRIKIQNSDSEALAKELSAMRGGGSMSQHSTLTTNPPPDECGSVPRPEM